MNFKDFYKTNLTFVLEDISILLEGTGLKFKNIVKIHASNRNKKFLDLRQEGNTGSKLKNLDWNLNKDHIILTYDTVATEDSGTTYNLKVMFEDPKKHLGPRKEFLEQSSTEQLKRFRNMLNNGTVKLHSNDPSFIWQGVWERAAKKGYAIEEFPPGGHKAGKDIWKGRHENRDTYLTKHLMEALKTIPFLATKITKMIRDKYS